MTLLITTPPFSSTFEDATTSAGDEGTEARPRPTKSCTEKTIHSLVYKGPMEVDYSAEPVAIEVDETNCDQAAFPKLPIIATIAGQDILRGRPPRTPCSRPALLLVRAWVKTLSS